MERNRDEEARYIMAQHPSRSSSDDSRDVYYLCSNDGN